MQIALEKPILHRPKKVREISSRFSAGLTNRQGKTGVVKAMPLKFEKKVQHEKTMDFSSWSMPEQQMGVIKCREHDFL